MTDRPESERIGGTAPIDILPKPSGLVLARYLLAFQSKLGAEVYSSNAHSLLMDFIICRKVMRECCYETLTPQKPGYYSSI